MTRRLSLLAILLSACAASTGSGDVDGGSGTGTDGGSATSGERTIATCTTSIADDVPAFYKAFFRCVTITKSAGGVVISTSDLPPHQSAYYPASSPNHTDFDTRGGAYHQNPNVLTEQHFSMTIPDAPESRGLTVTSDMVDHTARTNPNEFPMGPAGVAIDSVEEFNDEAAPGDDISQEKYTFDSYEAHPAAGGQYHYHSASPGPLEVLKAEGLVTTTTPGDAAVELYGIMCDGTVLLGCTELDGSQPDATQLDAQNGHTGDIRDAKGTVYFTGRYHTHVCPSKLPHQYTPEIQFYKACTRTQ